MTEFKGGNAYATWVHAGGTLVLSSDYRSISDAPSVALLNARAGTDAYETYIVDAKDGQTTITMLAQEGGTALLTALAEGTSGTLNIGEEGTATGKPKTSFPAISMGAQRNIQYNNLVEISVTFQQNGTRTQNVW